MAAKLLYRVADHNGGLVFAREADARQIARIHQAIECAKTWADFRRAMPREEYSEIVHTFDDNGEPRPKGSDEFSSEMLPGYSDGDFPHWLQSEMDRLIPQHILERHGELKSTFINGGFWWIDPSKASAVCRELEAAGWTVEHASDLAFW